MHFTGGELCEYSSHFFTQSILVFTFCDSACIFRVFYNLNPITYCIKYVLNCLFMSDMATLLLEVLSRPVSKNVPGLDVSGLELVSHRR